MSRSPRQLRGTRLGLRPLMRGRTGACRPVKALAYRRIYCAKGGRSEGENALIAHEWVSMRSEITVRVVLGRWLTPRIARSLSRAPPPRPAASLHLETRPAVSGRRRVPSPDSYPIQDKDVPLTRVYSGAGRRAWRGKLRKQESLFRKCGTCAEPALLFDHVCRRCTRWVCTSPASGGGATVLGNTPQSYMRSRPVMGYALRCAGLRCRRPADGR